MVPRPYSRELERTGVTVMVNGRAKAREECRAGGTSLNTSHSFGDGHLPPSVGGYHPSIAKTRSPFAGITTRADAGNPWSGPPFATTRPPFPAVCGLTQLS